MIDCNKNVKRSTSTIFQQSKFRATHFMHNFKIFDDSMNWNFWSNYFRDFFLKWYYDDFRIIMNFIVKFKQKIFDFLTKTHFLMNFFDERNVRVVIIIIFQTWTIRHESNALQFWRKNQNTKNNKNNLNNEWNRDLIKNFEMTLIDEAHAMRNFFFQITTTLTWLNSHFIILMIDTSLSNEIFDFKKLMRLIQTSQTNDWWNSQNLFRFEIIVDINSFEFKNFDFASILQFTKYVVNEFILRKNYDSFTQNVYLRKIYRHFFFDVHTYRDFFIRHFLSLKRVCSKWKRSCSIVNIFQKNERNSNSFKKN